MSLKDAVAKGAAEVKGSSAPTVRPMSRKGSVSWPMFPDPTHKPGGGNVDVVGRPAPVDVPDVPKE